MPQSGHFVGTGVKLPIPELHLNDEKSIDTDFNLIFWTKPDVYYTAYVNENTINSMCSNKKLNYQNGVVLELIRKIGNRDVDQEKIHCVLEHCTSSAHLIDTKYDSFSMRKMVYYHNCCMHFEIYAPLLAVNLT